jgi:hypothetical protein
MCAVDPSTADLKFLHQLQRVRRLEFQIDGTRIVKLLVPLAFRNSLRGGCCDVSRTSESGAAFVACSICKDENVVVRYGKDSSSAVEGTVMPVCDSNCALTSRARSI